MALTDDLRWFKDTFHEPVAAATAGTPFGLDLLAAIALQESGEIWRQLRGKVGLDELLELCVGDSLDDDRGRRAFPKNQAALLAVSRGNEMFAIAHDALVRMAVHVKGYQPAAKKAHKFCRGFGIFQYDLQFFKVDPEYFLQRRWRHFDLALGRCIRELQAAQKRIGLTDRSTLTDLEQVHVAIAYNCGGFNPQKGLQQGHRAGDGRFYGENIFDFLRLAQSIPSPSAAAAVEPPLPGEAPLAPPAPVRATGATFEVDVETAPLRLRREPKIVAAKPSSNVIAHLPDGHRVRLISGRRSDKFLEVETSLNGALLRGFAASQFLVPVGDDVEIPVVLPTATVPIDGVVAVHAPRKSASITKRTAPAGALPLNEANQPSRIGTTPQELRSELATIIDYLAVDKVAHVRYQPRNGATFCNIYAHDFCHLAGLYLPRVWWTPDAVERLTRGEVVEPRLGGSIDEQRANDLFRWLRAFGPRFGWRQAGSLTELQTEANLGAVGVIVARRKIEGKSGHITIVVPETDEHRAKRDAAGTVTAPLQSQAGARNFRYATSSPNWWNGEQFADSAFWIHA